MMWEQPIQHLTLIGLSKPAAFILGQMAVCSGISGSKLESGRLRTVHCEQPRGRACSLRSQAHRKPLWGQLTHGTVSGEWIKLVQASGSSTQNSHSYADQPPPPPSIHLSFNPSPVTTRSSAHPSCRPGPTPTPCELCHSYICSTYATATSTSQSN